MLHLSLKVRSHQKEKMVFNMLMIVFFVVWKPVIII